MLLSLAAVTLVWGIRVLLPDPERAPYSGDVEQVETPGMTQAVGILNPLDAFARRRSDVWVEGSGIVQRTLTDDTEGSRHQRFVVELAGGQTVLVAHNIDLADRVPLSPGERIAFRGEYEWTSQGGVVHWTHHDPRGNRHGGWIRHQNRDYR
jgi:hypothetical protein